MTASVRPFLIVAALISLAGALAMSGSALAKPLVPAEQRYLHWSGAVPLCDDSGVLDKISSRFSAREGEFWQSGLEIAGYSEISEIGLRSPGLDFIPRRYCVAKVQLNSGKKSTVSYAIGEDLGWLGAFGWGVNWCVEGLDRNFADAPGCKMARP